jgi:broad specificity phosphatase PhoE
MGPVTRAVHGSLRRQVQTVEACLPALGGGVDVLEDPRWNEYDGADLLRHVGGEGSADDVAADEDPRRAFQRLLELAVERWTSGRHDADYAEPYPAFHARVRTALDDLIAGLDRSETVAVFTSGGVIAALCAQWLGADAQGWARLNRVVVNSSISKLVHGRSGTNLVTVNDHAHLEGRPRELLTYR